MVHRQPGETRAIILRSQMVALYLMLNPVDFMQILQLISLSLLFGAALGHRALTLEAENYVTALFQSINPGIVSHYNDVI